MSRQLLQELFSDGPCFISNTYGIQGVPARHVFMTGAINVMSGLTNESLRLLEIGSWTGSSALTWAQAIDHFCPAKGEVVCLDSWDTFITEEDLTRGDIYQHMHTLSSTGISYDLFLHNMQFARDSIPVRHFRGKSCDIMPYLGDSLFDIVYIDGSHYYDDVLFDIHQSIRVLKEGGILCGDDLELQMSECDQDFAVSQRRIDYVDDPKTGKYFHPGVTTAVHEVLGTVSNYAGFWLMQKTAEGFKMVSLNGRNMLLPDHFPEIIKKSIMQQFSINRENRTGPIQAN